jgi:pimeloyl-ACP methyl ester carboxylesterase
MRAARRQNLARLMIRDLARIDATALAIREWKTAQARLRSRGFAGSAMLKTALAPAGAPPNAIRGECDAVARPAVEARLAVLRARDPSLLEAVIPGAGHWVAYEAPEAFNAALLGMLRARAAGTAR